MIFNNHKITSKKENTNIFDKFNEKPLIPQAVIVNKCPCQKTVEITSNQMMCLDCGALCDKKEDISLDERKLIRNEMGERPPEIDYKLAKYLHWKRFEDDIIEKIDLAEQECKKPKIPKQIIKESFDELKELWDTINIKGKNPERVLAYRLLTICDEEGLEYSKKYITNILEIEDGEIEQGIKVYSDFEIAKGEEELHNKESSPVESHHKNFTPTDEELEYSKIIIDLFAANHIFMESVDATKGKKIVTLLEFMRIKEEELHTAQHEKHIKRLNIKFGVCWKCLVSMLKDVGSDVRELKEIIDAIEIIKIDLEEETKRSWDWLFESSVNSF